MVEGRLLTLIGGPLTTEALGPLSVIGYVRPHYDPTSFHLLRHYYSSSYDHTSVMTTLADIGRHLSHTGDTCFLRHCQGRVAFCSGNKFEK